MIAFLDLKQQYASIGADIEAAVLNVLRSGRYVLGEEVAAFETEFAAACGVRHAIAVNTGTSALHLALLAAGVTAGDEVITTPFTFIATAAAIRYIGARPVFVDIDPATFTIDPARIERAITPRTRAIIPVHLYGQMANMDAIMAIAARHGLAVVEDACQAHGSRQHGRSAGSIGLSGCFSFYPGKNLGACGEGGMAVTNDDEQARLIRMLRDWGQDRRYHHVMEGYNYRMDAIQGAALRVKLRQLESWTEARRARAQLYGRLLANSPVEPPREAPWNRHVWHIFAVRTSHRDQLQKYLAREGVETGLHYPVPVHLQPAYADLGHRPGDFPASEAAADSVLSLPIYPELSVRAVETVCALVGQDAYVS
ncbi:MAG: DegT/DnrJ/EryC1/StrS family aminotransferase [Alphaproteobacteria bacterium]|nr:DegT/DnrJ/EryC1/StrS family aminotransferase [Alphaproteobacteria bacterium]MBU1561606.1 DegT/DnrJ/EryC1/StrS family aminotransferase [Alphaproteobacteria bacterium]MBU2302413.1 DegT/DnrJ/EryC1/StrS family aminotransferase [Alphaproteobacteria bacterium]MBU2368693.1 DegT/DnrJ/EryC1/StrS family aminotransferase [Alphaproteobacteria bacterium]